jgi:hypothetical protein
MTQATDFVPMPLQIAANLRNLTGEEFKILGVFCYQTYNQQTPEIAFDQIQSMSGIPRDRIKPTLHRLLNRGWIVARGAFYALALGSTPSQTAAATVHYDTALGIRPPRPKAYWLYPEGPWLTENGLLNQDFIRDRASVWRTGSKAFGEMAIEDVMGAVCKHYAQPEHHTNLEIDWQSYCLKNQRYLSNVQQRMQAGIAIDAQEQATVLNKLPILVQEPQPVYEAVSALPAVQLELPALTPEAPPVSPPRRLPARQLDSKLDQLQLWLSDPILRSEAERRARSQGYDVEYDESGVAIAIREARAIA